MKSPIALLIPGLVTMDIVILNIILYFKYLLADLFRNFLQETWSEQVVVEDREGGKKKSLILLTG